MKRPFLLLVILLLFALVPSLLAQGETTPVAPTPPPDFAPPPVSQIQIDEMVEAARRAEQRAGEMIETSNYILNFFEVLSAIAGFVLTIGAVLGFTSIRGLRAEVEEERKRIEAARAELASSIKAAADNMERLQRDYDAQLTAGLEAMEQQRNAVIQLRDEVETEIMDVRSRGDKAIRALTLVQLGEQQMNESNWRAAMRTFEDACRLDSDNRAVNYYLGELFIMQRDLDKAEHHLRKAHDEKHAEGGDDTDVFPPAEAALAYVLRLRGDRETNYESRAEYYASAERRFRKAIRLDEYVRDINGESVFGMLGALCRQANRTDDAIRYYEKALTITPHSSYPVNNLAMLYYRRGDVAKARPYFERAIQLARQRIDNNPSDYWAYFDLINGLIATAQTDDARIEVDNILPTIHIRGPLESFNTGLTVLAESPVPPPEIGYFLNRVESARQQVEAEELEQSAAAFNTH